MLRTLSFSLAFSFSLIGFARGAEAVTPMMKVEPEETDQQIIDRSRIESEAQLKAALEAKAKIKAKILADEQARTAEVEEEFAQRIQTVKGTTASVTVGQPVKTGDLPNAKTNASRRANILPSLKGEQASEAADKEAKAIRLQELLSQEVNLRNKAWDQQMKLSMSSICRGC